MNRKISADELAEAVGRELSDYGNAVSAGLKEAVQAVAKQTVATLKKTSPKRTGAYRQGWRVQWTKRGRSVLGTISNRLYQLTHLLEFGYQKAAGGRVEGQPHIEPAAEAAETALLARVEQVIEEAGG